MLRRHNLILLVLTTSLAVWMLALVTLGSASGPGGDSPGASGGPEAYRQVQARLDELAATLARLEERECHAAPTRDEGPAPAEPWAGLREDVQALARGIDALEREVGGLREAALPPRSGGAPAPRAELATLREARPEADWFALDRIAAAWSRDPREAREALQFLSPAELLERFGAPSRVRGEGDGEVRWTYGSGAEGAPRSYRVSLSLHDGYVTTANVFVD